MSQHDGLNRRAFLRTTGMTALAGAVGSGSALAAVTGRPAAAAAAPLADSSKFDFDTPYSRLGTDSVKWDTALTQNEMGTITAGMGIADMDFKCAPSITQALEQRLKHEVWGYLTVPKAFPEQIATWNKQHYGLNVNPETMTITTGVHPGIIATLRAVAPAGSKVLLITPTYNGFYGDLTYTDTKPEESLMKYVDGRYQIDFDDFEKRCSSETKAFILCNPQNPTGNMWSEADLMRLGEICLKHNVLVLADEIHCDFANKGVKYVPFASLPNKAVVNNSITFKAASKSFGLAAMKCAWCFSDNMDLVAKMRRYNRADLSTLGYIANKGAYDGGSEWLRQCVDYIDGNHDFAQKYIKSNIPMIKVGQKAQGTYLMWLDVSEVADRINAKQMAADAAKTMPGRNGRGPSPEAMVTRWIAKNAKVALNAGDTYGLGGANHQRMNIATSRKTLEAALASMAKTLDGLKKTTTAAVL